MHTDFVRRVILAVAFSLTAAPLAHAQSREAGTQKPAPAAVKPAAGDKPVNADAAALADFKKRVDDYVAVHRKAAGSVTPLKETNNPAEITVAQDALAEKIRAARADARAGDIFTPEIRATFRKVLRPELKGEDGKDTKEVLKDDAPASIPLKVNAKYPAGATRPTVPAKVLTNLPTLPKEVEYRIADGHLVLLDAQAWIVVDFIPNAVAQ